MKHSVPWISIAALACTEPPPAAGNAAAPTVANNPMLAMPPLSSTLRVGAPEVPANAPEYALTLDLRWGLFTYGGTSTVRYVNAERDTLTELNFLLYPNSGELTEPGTRQLLVSDVTIDGVTVASESAGDRLRVPLPKPLLPGEALTVAMSFEGVVTRLPAKAHDLEQQAMNQVLELVLGESQGKGGFGVFAYGDRILSLGLWYPILAAYDDRGWDLDRNGGVGDVSYFDVANYRVTVTAPASVRVASTGVELASRVEGERRTTELGAAGVREFTVEASEHFQTAESVVNGVTVRSWFLEGDSEAGRRVLDYATAAMAVFERRFGPYPYTELDVVEAPLVGGAGGVEFPGLVTIGRMFYSPDHPGEGTVAEGLAKSQYLRDTLEFVVAHEVAHEWWNATVGSDSKRHPFVDEALANHSAILYFEEQHGKAKAAEQVGMQLKLPYQLARMTGANDRPVDLPTADFGGMMEYAAIVYGKGALFFEAARQQMGDEAYFAFLKNHYAQHGFKVATADDLIGGLVRASPDQKGALALVNRWLQGTHGDEDIGPVDVALVMRSVLGDEAVNGELGKIARVLSSKGMGELGKVVSQLISPDGTAKEAVNWGAVLSLVKDLAGEDDGSLLGMAADVLEKHPEALAPGGDPTVLVKEALKKLAGDDPGTVAAIEAADAIVRLVTALDP